MSKTSQNRSKTLLVLSWLSRMLSWSILEGFWVRLGMDLEAWGCVTNQARCHKNNCRGDLRPQDRSNTILDDSWRPSGTILDRFWKDFGCELEGIWTPQAASRTQFADIKITSGDTWGLRIAQVIFCSSTNTKATHQFETIFHIWWLQRTACQRNGTVAENARTRTGY